MPLSMKGPDLNPGPGHYPSTYTKYLREVKSRSTHFAGSDLDVCRSGEVFCSDKLLSRSWDGTKNDYIIEIPTKNQKFPEIVHVKKLISIAYNR